MDTLWDIVIVGGGLGGLALAAELAAPEFATLSVLVLEKRGQYVRDRTWSYWAITPHRYSLLERHRWKRWTVSLGNTVHSQHSQQSSYASLDADAFYKATVSVIQATSHVVLQMDSCVAGMQVCGPTETVITLEQGSSVRARRVLDARPAPQCAASGLVQQFAGWEIHLQHDLFDASQVQLMSFQPNAHGLHFFYVLPYSARCALVESTWVSSATWQPNFEAELQHYIASRCGSADYTVSYREHGILNLQEVHPQAAEPVGLGRRGGTLRPSTGYAFTDTLAHAAQIAQSLSIALRAGTQDTWQPAAFHRATTETWMDAVFLEVLTRDWKRAPDYFMHLFGSVEVDDTVAFLTGQASWRQRLHVMRSLPATPFARVALQRVFSGRWPGKFADRFFSSR